MIWQAFRENISNMEGLVTADDPRIAVIIVVVVIEVIEEIVVDVEMARISHL